MYETVCASVSSIMSCDIYSNAKLLAQSTSIAVICGHLI